MTLLGFQDNPRNDFTGTTKKVGVDLLSSNTPSTFPETGEGIKGLGSEYVLLPGSTIWVTDGATLYMADEEMNWVEQ